MSWRKAHDHVYTVEDSGNCGQLEGRGEGLGEEAGGGGAGRI